MLHPDEEDDGAIFMLLWEARDRIACQQALLLGHMPIVQDNSSSNSLPLAVTSSTTFGCGPTLATDPGDHSDRIVTTASPTTPTFNVDDMSLKLIGATELDNSEDTPDEHARLLSRV